MGEPRLSDEQLQDLYTWVDQVPLTRQKRNIARDFSDGVLFAEVIMHYHPKLIDLHNYSPANGLTQKMYNWETLQKRVFRKLKLTVTKDELQAVAECKPMHVERLLLKLRPKLAAYKADVPVRRQGGSDAGSVASSSYGRASMAMMKNPAAFHDAARNSSRRDEEDDEYSRPAYMSGTPRGGGIGGGIKGGDLRALLEEKDQTIAELQDTVSILELKVKKMDELIKLKDRKIAALQQQNLI
mmetsp:Transcript_904/g.2104  ORF Transcript_904/g.2104 Transcript_904/m.2104 type:complete len:241 (+) Transcript_904:344-1066(+)